jgi:predicted tellurium resistance membrane protein TerC
MLEPQGWVAFLTLAGLELVLGIDNIVFISILVGKLPKERQRRAYRIGLGLALISRVLLLLSISWVMGLTRPLFTVLENVISGRDLVLIVGGLFLVAKSTHEIHDKLEGEEGERSARALGSYGAVLVQIMALDVIFSLDSVITAVGMVNKIGLMVSAIVVSIIVMMLFAGAIGDFVHKHPTVKMLALAFLIMIGVMLVADGLGHHIPKGYIYFSMAFSLFVEMLNLRAKKVHAPVELRSAYVDEKADGGT